MGCLQCAEQVPSAIVHELLSPEEAARYDKYSLRSYVEDNRAMSWCTGQVCVAGLVNIEKRFLVSVFEFPGHWVQPMLDIID